VRHHTPPSKFYDSRANSGGGAGGAVLDAGSLTFLSGIQQGHSMPTLPPGPYLHTIGLE